jgi:hypothetical protein
MVEKLKKFGMWLVAGLLAAGGAVLVYLKLKEDEKAEEPVKLPEASPETTAAVHHAEGKAEAEKAAAAEKATETKTELAEVAATDDGAERRKKLAAMANQA